MMKYKHWFLGGGLLLLLGWLLLKGWRIYRAVDNLRGYQAAVMVLAEGEMGTGGMTEAAEVVLGVRREFIVLRDETAFLMPLTPYLSWLPRVGPLMPHARPLVAMADAGTETGAVLMTAFYPALIASQEKSPEEPLIPLLLAQLQSQPEALAQAQASYGRLLAARAQIESTAAWPHTPQTLLAQFDQVAELAAQGLAITPALPELAGGLGRRTYLIVAQNQEELRPTGGFISGAGLLVVEEGRIVSLEFRDAYTVDNWDALPYDFPPQPLYQFMGLELFLFRDSNYWPDFPTSAEQMMRLYTYGTGTAVDGVIAFDQGFLIALVQGLGQVYIPELDLTLTPDNVQAELRAAWETGDEEDEQWLHSRKSFMGPMANAIRNQLENGLGEADLVELGDAVGQALAEKHLQIYVREPHTAALLRQVGWDGQLHGRAGHDTLAVVDFNMGYNKANVLVETSIAYEVSLAESQPRASLTLTYTHASPNTSQPCDPTIPAYTRGLQYETLVDRCYWNYVRVYAPAGTALQTADAHPVPAEMFLTKRPWAGEAWQEEETAVGLTSLHNFLLLRRGQTLASQMTYQLPEAVRQEQSYTLLVAHQAGRKPTPVQILLWLPAGAEVTSAVPTPTSVNAQQVVWQLTLAQDEQFAVTWVER